MKTLLKLSIGLILLIALSACKKDDPQTSIVRNWKLDKVIYKDGSGTMQTITNNGSATLNLTEDNKYTSTLHTAIGGTDLPFSTSTVSTGTWELSLDNTTVTYVYDYNHYTLVFEIGKLTDSEFTFNFNVGGLNEQTFYFKK